MPNSSNPFLLLTTEHLIFNGIYYYIELKKNTEKKQSSLKIRCKSQFRAFLPIYKTVSSQSIVQSINQNEEEGKGEGIAKRNLLKLSSI